MNTEANIEQRIVNALAQGCAALAAAIGLLALLGWLLRLPLLTTLGSNLIPMAPSTALLFLLLGSSVFARAALGQTRVVRRMGMAAGFLCALLALALLVTSAQGIYLDVERLGFPASTMLARIPVGHMSPLTALSLALASTAFLAFLFASSARRWLTSLAISLAFLVLALNAVLLIAYFFASPILYGGAFIPPALPTSLAFIALGVALLALIQNQGGLSTGAIDRPYRAPYTLFLLFFVLALGITGIGYVYYRNFETQYRRQVESQLSAIAQLKSADLQRWRRERLGDGASLYRNGAFYTLVQEFLDNSQAGEPQRQLRSWLGRIEAAYDYERVFLLDTEGVERVSASGTPPADAPRFPHDIAETLRSQQVTLLDLYRDGPGEAIRLAVLVPILDERTESQALGVLVLLIDPEVFLFPSINRWPTPSETAETLLVRRDGNDVLFLSELRFQQNTALTLRFPLDRLEMPAVKAVLGQQGIVEGLDHLGNAVVADVRPINNSSWFLVTRMDVSEIYAPMVERLWLTLLVIGLLLFGVGAGASLLWRQQQVRQYRERYEAQAALRRSEEQFKALFQTMTEGVAIHTLVRDPQGAPVDFELINANPAYHTHIGLGPGAAIGKKASALYGPGAPLYLENYTRVTTTGEPTTFDAHFDPLQKHFRISAFMIGPERIATILDDITGRKLAEERIAHLNAVLRAIRNVNQLIVRETDRQRLLQASCEQLIETRGYQSVWIAQTDRSGKPVSMAEAGIGAPFDAFQARWLAGQAPDCARQAMEQPDLNLIDPAIKCEDCPLLDVTRRSGTVTIRLEFAGEILGVLAVAGAREFLEDNDERDLLMEVAGDLAFALHGIDLEEDRRRVEEALRKSEERHRSLVELSPLAVYVHRNNQIEYLNPACLRLLGASSADQILGKSPFDILHPDCHALVRERINVLYQEGTDAPLIEEKVVRLDGAVHDVEVAASRFTDSEGDAIQVVLNNITERKHAEKEIRNLARFPSENPNPVLRLRHDGMLLYANGRSNWLLEDWACAVGDCAPAFWQEVVAGVLSAQADRTIDIEYRDKSWTFVAAHVPGEDYVNLYGSEITLRKRAKERLQAINHLARAISSDLSIDRVYDTFVAELLALMPVDRTALVLMNEAEDQWQIRRQWTQHKPAFQVGAWYPVQGSVMEWLAKNRVAFSESEVGERGDWPESEALRREGIRSRLLVPLIMRDRLVGVLSAARCQPGAFSDEEQSTLAAIADQLVIAVQNAQLYEQVQQHALQLEDRVNRRTAELETANKELEAFSYTVSHDLRAPLRAVDGFSRILFEEYTSQLPAEAQRYLGLVRENALQMGNLIDDLLTFSRLGRQPLKKQQVRPADVVQAVLPTYRAAEEGRQVEVVTGELPPCQADPGLLRQVYANLLGNAFKYTRNRDVARIEVGHMVQDGEVVYFVKDNGVGFDMQYAHKLFGVFQRLHRAEEYEGTGVGLAIARRIIHRHGGRIWAEAEVDRGATFFFTMEEGRGQDG